MVTAITRGLAATTWFPSGTSLATTTTVTVAATTMTVTVAATTTRTATKPAMAGISATTIDNRIAGGLFAVATLRPDLPTAHGCDMAGPGAVMRGDALRKAGLPE